MSVRGSKLLGRWLRSDKVEVIERLHKGPRQQDAAVVFRMKATGQIIAVIPRKHRESYRGGENMISKARKKKVETWGADTVLMNKCRRHNPTHLVLFLTDTEDYFLSRFADWFDPHKRITRTSEWSKQTMYHLPTHLMIYVPSKKRLHAE